MKIHLEQLEGNSARWDRKPILKDVYGEFYRWIAKYTLPSEAGVCLELGSGSGRIKEAIPHCVTSEIVRSSAVDRTEDAYNLTYSESSIATLILIDVFHHLEYPFRALAEFARATKPGGRVILLEPDASLLGYLVYGLFHHEPIGDRSGVRVSPPEGWQSGHQDYYAAQGNARRIFIDDWTKWSNEMPAWRRLAVERQSQLAYALSGGFTGPQCIPRGLIPAIRGVEKVLDCAPSVFSLRMLVVLERKE